MTGSAQLASECSAGSPDERAVVTVIQARTGSTRLPGKVMLPLLGKPVLARMLERVAAASLAGTIVVATTTGRQDDCIENLALEEGFAVFRGHPTDLVDRHHRAAQWLDAEVVVKIPSDCPLIDPGVIDRVIGEFLAASDSLDYVGNLHPPTYPDGNDVEVMSAAALATVLHEATQDFEREHTTPFLWERPRRFRVGNVTWETGLDYSTTHRWVLDYPEDYTLIRALFEALYPADPLFDLADILDLLAESPDLVAINAGYRGVNWYAHPLGQLQIISANETRLGLP